MATNEKAFSPKQKLIHVKYQEYRIYFAHHSEVIQKSAWNGGA